MREAGRLQAAIEVLEDVIAHHRPVGVALADWGRTHRFAGSGDRAAIGNLVYDAMRHRASISAMMGAEGARALALGAMDACWGLDPAHVADLCDGSKFAPEPLDERERAALAAEASPEMPDHARADVPEWLWPAFEVAFGSQAVAEGRALSERPPLDLRVNTLKADRDKVAAALSRHGPEICATAPDGLRIAAPQGAGRLPNVRAETGYRKGWFEIQDEGSQVAAALVGAEPGQQVLDVCAGAGGKTLALAAAMHNRGQVYAYDGDRQRLAPIHERLKRAGARNVQVRTPAGADAYVLDDLAGLMHRVVVDAPCSGSGIWRRRPESKWRLNAAALEARTADQAAILESAAKYVRPGGRLCYITCSVLARENEDQIAAFLSGHPGFAAVDGEALWAEVCGKAASRPRFRDRGGILMTPARTGTDGFFFAAVQRQTGDDAG